MGRGRPPLEPRDECGRSSGRRGRPSGRAGRAGRAAGGSHHLAGGRAERGLSQIRTPRSPKLGLPAVVPDSERGGKKRPPTAGAASAEAPKASKK